MLESFSFNCPYCASLNTSPLDPSQGNRQEWITDCEVCCRPILVRIELDGEELLSVSVHQENE
ncbi:MAG TPA: CPXCG motif-containing cysteine-rich protein [Candidatus Omnitrophota bacterium]|nr:CPXCG motif-containing cysteine-rich protein [Candidatus Omnitrophota bacterium]